MFFPFIFGLSAKRAKIEDKLSVSAGKCGATSFRVPKS